MDGFEWNKIAGWTLAAVFAILGLSIITGEIFAVPSGERGYVVPGVELAAPEAAAAPAEQPIGFYLASASVQKGEAQFRKCSACHSVAKGAAPAIGPNLWGIVGSHHAHEAGYAYSDAMKATADRVWDWDSLSAWIDNPKAYIPGNKMAFAGIARPQDRADVLAYLNSESDAPLPLPEAPAASAADGQDGDGAGAGGAGAAADDASAAEAPAPTI